MMIHGLAQDEPLPLPPAIIVPPDTSGSCPSGYKKQTNGSCKLMQWYEDPMILAMIIGGFVLLLLLSRRR